MKKSKTLKNILNNHLFKIVENNKTICDLRLAKKEKESLEQTLNPNDYDSSDSTLDKEEEQLLQEFLSKKPNSYLFILNEKVIKANPKNPKDFRKFVKGNIFYVEFIKKYEKKLRKMIATTNLEYVPRDKHPKGPRKDYKNQIRVFDLQKNAWRSFDIRTLLVVKIYTDTMSAPIWSSNLSADIVPPPPQEEEVFDVKLPNKWEKERKARLGESKKNHSPKDIVNFLNHLQEKLPSKKTKWIKETKKTLLSRQKAYLKEAVVDNYYQDEESDYDLYGELIIAPDWVKLLKSICQKIDPDLRFKTIDVYTILINKPNIDIELIVYQNPNKTYNLNIERNKFNSSSNELPEKYYEEFRAEYMSANSNIWLSGLSFVYLAKELNKIIKIINKLVKREV